MSKDANGLEILTLLLATDPVRFDVTNVPLVNLEDRTNDLLERVKSRGTNLPGNPGFEDGPITLFSTPANGTVILPFWTSQGLTPAGSEAQKETVLTKDSNGAIRILTNAAATGRVEQSLSSSAFKALRGQKVTFSVDARFLTTNANMRMQIDDGVGTSTFTSTTLSATYQRFTVERTIDVAASQCIIKLFGNDGAITTGQTLFDNVMFQTGSYPLGSPFLFDATEDVPVSISTETISPAGGTTTLTLLTFTYVPGTNQIAVYRNGVKMLPSTITEASPTTITIPASVAADDYEVVKIA